MQDSARLAAPLPVFRGASWVAALAVALAGLPVGCGPATTDPTNAAAPAQSPDAASPPKTTTAAADVAKFNRALGLLEQDYYDRVAEALTPIVAKHPDWTAARFNRALALLHDQRDESLRQAEADFLRILEKEPDHRHALFCLARVYQCRGDSTKAVDALGRLYKLDSDDPAAAYCYATALESLGRSNEALAVLDAIVARDPGFVSGVYRLGSLYRTAKQPDKAHALLARFKKLHEKELIHGSYQLTDYYGGMGKYSTAIAADGLPLPPARMSPAPRVVFSPDVRKIDVTLKPWLKPWKWAGGEVQTPGVAVGDLNGDGHLDLLIAGLGDGGAAQVYFGDGKGRFTAGPRLADRVVSPCLGDVNNDGHLDIWLGRAGEDLLLLGDGKGHFTKAKDHPGEEPSEKGRPDKDSRLSLRERRVFRGAKGDNAGPPLLDPQRAVLTASARMLDLDDDGDLDLLSVRIGGGNVPPGARQVAAATAVYVNRSPFRFSEDRDDPANVVPADRSRTILPQAPLDGPRRITLADNIPPSDKGKANESSFLGAMITLFNLFSSDRKAAAPEPPDADDSENAYKGGFEDVAASLGLAMEKTPLAAVLYDDFDNDRDVDLLLLPAHAPPIGWENHRVGRFTLHEAAETGLNVSGAAGATSGDPFKTGRRSVLVFGGNQLTLFHNKGRWKFEKDAQFAARFGALGGTSGQFVDIDNDGDLDLVIADAHRRDGTRGPVLLLNDWPNRRFVDASEVDPGNLLSAITVPGNAVCVAGDFAESGRCDLLLLPCGGQPMLIENLTKGGHWLAMDLVGDRGQQKKSRSPNVAIGARVEWHAGTLWQQHVVGAPAGATAMPPLQVLAGLGAETQVQWLRILWPDAILQAELEIGGDQRVLVLERNRRRDSCPHLFAWTGRHYEFVSDFGGVGGLGYRTGPGSFARPDPTEYVVLPALVPQEGDYVLQVIEHLQEIVYLDELKLLAVDHPAGTTVFPNEMAAVSVPPPPFELFCFQRPIEPVRAVNHRGEDVTDALRRTDRVYAAGIAPRRSFLGLARPYHIDLDFGDRLDAVPAGSRRILMLDGWVEYSTSTSNYAAAQAGLRPEAPSVFVRRGGRWVELLHEVGYPAGMNHRMTLDLTGLLHRGDRVLRIASNMEIYWDRAFLAAVERGQPGQPGQPGVAIHEVAARSGHLHFRGYPREYSPDGRLPNLFDYANLDHSITWLRMPGAYTRYGDVTELLAAADDCFAIMAPGDEVTVRFSAAALPPVPLGFTRTFLLKTDSYCKDMDLYTGGNARVEPLPFHAMLNYPYGTSERYPDTEKTRQYRARYNTRVVEE